MILETSNIDLKQIARVSQYDVYGMTLYECMQNNHQVFAVCADTSNISGLSQAFAQMPDRCINVGIAEQNMVGIAAGIASISNENNIPNNVFISTYASFAVERVFELLKMQVATMNLNVKVVGMLSGFASNFLGNSHYCLTDLALTRMLPSFIVLSPADLVETMAMVRFLTTYQGPAYLRLTGVNGMPMVHDENFTFTLGKAECLLNGEDIAILATGCMVNESLRAGQRLQKRNISAAVYNFSTIKPLDEAMLTEILTHFKHVITVEEHYLESGFGSAVVNFSNQLALSGTKVKAAGIKKIGVECAFSKPGSYAGLTRSHNLNAQHIIKTAESMLQP